MEASLKRLFTACATSLAMALVLNIIYAEWGRHLVDVVASRFLPMARCEAFDMAACQQSVSGVTAAQFFGYLVYLSILCPLLSFAITRLLIGNRPASLRKMLPCIALALGAPILIIWASSPSSLGYASLHFVLLFSGVASAISFRRGAPN